jgi:hypothetical protein
MKTWLPAGLCPLATMMVLLAAPTHAESLSVASSPPGANEEIHGVLVGTTPFRAEYPGGYFHKTHWFSARGSTIR